MTFIIDLFTNYMIICAFAGWFLAQVLKIFFNIIKTDKIDFYMILSSGGMPSSHSASVCALTVACAITQGTGSPLFAISLLFAFIVMYDAAGVRRAAGEQAKIINKFMAAARSGDADEMHKELKELIGHTPFEVLAGAVLGIIVPFIIRIFFKI